MHPFARQRAVSCWLSVGLFVLIFPYRIQAIGAYKLFCVILNGLSCGLFGWILYRALIRYLSVEQFSKYVWFLGCLAFCHLVFARLNPGSWLCIGAIAVIYGWMLYTWIRSKRNER